MPRVRRTTPRRRAAALWALAAGLAIASLFAACGAGGSVSTAQPSGPSSVWGEMRWGDGVWSP